MEEKDTMVLAIDNEVNADAGEPSQPSTEQSQVDSSELIKIKKFVIDYPVTAESPNQEDHRQNAIIYIDIDQVQGLPDALCWVDLP